MDIPRDELIRAMTGLLEKALQVDSEPTLLTATAAAPLLGPEAVLSSLNLVSLIMDVEATVSESWGEDVTLVNEAALSRRQSPFRTIEAMADYVLELVQTARKAAAVA